MTPRYFYRDPLEAAFMSKYYGIRFLTSFMGIEQEWKNKTTGHGESGWKYEISFGWDEKHDRFFIHPDSEHILAPQVGDLGLDSNNVACLCDGNDWTQLGIRGFAKHPVRIIQRLGGAFMWPESE